MLLRDAGPLGQLLLREAGGFSEPSRVPADHGPDIVHPRRVRPSREEVYRL